MLYHGTRVCKVGAQLDRPWPGLSRPLRGLGEFYERWLATHLGLRDWFVEVGHSGPGNAGFARNMFHLPDTGAGAILDLRKHRNVMVSTARYPEPIADHESARYPLLVLDFDCPASPRVALYEAAALAGKLEEYGVDTVLLWSGFKGAHLYVPLKGLTTHSELITLAWAIARLVRPLECNGRPLVDWQALRDPRRLMRAPYTWNLKHGERRLAVILDERLKPLMPRDFEWGRPLEPRRFGIALVVSRVPRVRTRRPVAAEASKWQWIEAVLDRGLPDGRKRFILYVASRYLVNVLGLGVEEFLERLKHFLESSCARHGNCGRIYESWLRSVLRGVASGGYKPLSLRTLGERDPDLYRVIREVIESEV